MDSDSDRSEGASLSTGSEDATDELLSFSCLLMMLLLVLIVGTPPVFSMEVRRRIVEIVDMMTRQERKKGRQLLCQVEENPLHFRASKNV